MKAALAGELAAWFGAGAEIASLIGGAPLAGSGETVTLVDPADETPLLSYRDCGAAGVAAAMAAATEGLAAWQALTASARGRVLWRLGQLVRDRADSLALVEAVVAGKPLRDTRVEVAKVAEMFDYYAGWADKLHGEVIPVPTSHLNYTRREPIGIVAQLTPWNAPIFTAGWQIAPALAAGNAVVLKPSELTPVTSLCLARLAAEAGVPSGALNVLAGLGRTAGAALAGHPAVGKVVFVGSPATGRAVAAAAAANLRPCLLELGGKSANIVFADADLARAAKGAQTACFAAAGQSCTAGSRLLVQRRVHDRLLDLVAAGSARLRVGHPLDELTEIGPINNARQYARIDELVASGRTAGAEVVTGGGRPEAAALARGYYYAPTVLAGVRQEMPIAREEVFGPVLSVLAFDDEEEAVALANDTPFDLAGAVWTGDVTRAHRIAAGVRAGSFWVNGYRTLSVMSPFGGMQGSGYGRSSGREALLEYSQSKSVWVETDPAAPQPFGHGPQQGRPRAMTRRVLLGMFKHETNTFCVQPTDVENFDKLFCHRGEAIATARDGTNTEMGGFLDSAARFGWQPVHSVATLATPSGRLTERAWRELGLSIVETAQASPGLDGVLLALHGAMVAEGHDDAEGGLLQALRAVIGPDVPIAVTLDLHANVSDRMAALADILVSYRTYPHVDMAERGLEAGALLQRAMAGEIRPRTVVARRPQLEGLDSGRSDGGPMVELLAKARQFEAEEPGLLSVSLNAGFPLSDIEDVGPTVTVTGDGESPRWREIAEQLMDEVWATRHVVRNRFLTPAEAAAYARDFDGGGRPLVVADFADNPGAGSYGDATNLLKALLDARVEDAAFATIRDEAAAQALVAAGVGATVTLPVGGKVDPRFGGPPLDLTGEVVAVSDGDYVCEGPMWAGVAQSFGPSALLRVGGVEVAVASNLLQLLDREQFRVFGIEPAAKRVLALKSMQHFRAAFEPIAAEVVVADCGALASPDYRRLPFAKARRPIWPLDDDANFAG